MCVVGQSNYCCKNCALTSKYPTVGQEVKVLGNRIGNTFTGDKPSLYIAALSISILTVRTNQQRKEAQEEVHTGLSGRSERDVCEEG